MTIVNAGDPDNPVVASTIAPPGARFMRTVRMIGSELLLQFWTEEVVGSGVRFHAFLVRADLFHTVASQLSPAVNIPGGSSAAGGLPLHLEFKGGTLNVLYQPPGGDKAFLQGTFTVQPPAGGEPYALYVVDGSTAYTRDATGLLILDLSGGGTPRVVSSTIPLTSYYKRGINWIRFAWPVIATDGYLLASARGVTFDVKDPTDRRSSRIAAGATSFKDGAHLPDRRRVLAPLAYYGVGVIELPPH